MLLIDDFVAAGGGLLLLGNGAAWLASHSGASLDAYPMMRLAQPFGLAFPAAVIPNTVFYTFYPFGRQ